jgi:hypothetical protein
MNTFYLQLLTFPECTTANGWPAAPRAYIALKIHSCVQCPTPTGDCEFEVISPECVTVREIGESVDALIRELQTIRDQAHRFFDEEKLHHDEQADKANDDESK